MWNITDKIFVFINEMFLRWYLKNKGISFEGNVLDKNNLIKKEIIINTINNNIRNIKFINWRLYQTEDLEEIINAVIEKYGRIYYFLNEHELDINNNIFSKELREKMFHVSYFKSDVIRIFKKLNKENYTEAILQEVKFAWFWCLKNEANYEEKDKCYGFGGIPEVFKTLDFHLKLHQIYPESQKYKKLYQQYMLKQL